jgi:lipopolysaccharide/colanic/teichoic acid biosynthesis glycosyltransferase
MIIGDRRASLLLFLGDIVAFALSLYLTLTLRYWELPRFSTLQSFAVPFTFLFALWTLVFYSAGLYSKRISLFPGRLPNALLKTQTANIIFTGLFFFLIPTFGITPKLILVLYLVISLCLIALWRLFLYPRITAGRVRERAILLAGGSEVDELYAEVNANPRYGIEFTARDIEGDARAGIVVIERTLTDQATLARLTHFRGQVVEFEDLYEEVFDRVPLSRLGEVWFRENVATTDSVVYLVAKRLIDIVGGIAMGIVVIILIPFVWFANHIEGPGTLFLAQERFGRQGGRIRAYKFRSMTKNLSASGEWTKEGDNRVTKVGNFLRTTSLDEFPQFINIVKGELSLIGPRNDILGLGKRLSEALPYYEARYLVKPGVTGWAQINQQYEQGNLSPQSIDETKVRLAYDFYYLKHRSLGLDIVIALKTFKRMFFRVSSW